jgi:hypothetical protein
MKEIPEWGQLLQKREIEQGKTLKEMDEEQKKNFHTI